MDTSGDGRIDAREGMATTVFTVESLNLKSTNVGNYKKKGKGKGGTWRAATTVLAGEATYDVERRVRDARRALFSDPVAFSEMTPATFDLTRGAGDLDARSAQVGLRARARPAAQPRAQGVRALDRLGREGSSSPAKDTRRRLSRTSRCGASSGASSRRAGVAVLVVDARHPLLHTPPALYAHVARRLKKPLVLVLNKVDAIPRAAAEAWAEHLLAALPGVDAVVGFSSKDGGGGARGQRATRRVAGVPDALSFGAIARESGTVSGTVSARERSLEPSGSSGSSGTPPAATTRRKRFRRVRRRRKTRKRTREKRAASRTTTPPSFRVGRRALAGVPRARGEGQARGRRVLERGRGGGGGGGGGRRRGARGESRSERRRRRQRRRARWRPPRRRLRRPR